MEERQDQARTQEGGALSALGATLSGRFELVAAQRREYELGWLANLRSYRGIHDPETDSRIKAKKLSEAFLNMTRVKVRAMDSRLLDMLFPAGRQKNWSIAPTPRPQVDPTFRALVAQALTLELQAQQPGRQAPTAEEIDNAVKAAAEKACQEMEKTIDDQLTEGRYKRKARDIFHSGHIFGTGILKGPYLDEALDKRYVENPRAPGQFLRKYETKDTPWFEPVRVWDCYPDMSATNPEELDYVYERHIMNRAMLRKLARRRDFRGEAINLFIQTNPAGNARPRMWETEIKQINDKLAAVQDLTRKYEVIEFTGYLDAADLRDAGVEIPAGEENREFIANIWMLGPVVIKAAISPADKYGILPYHFYYYEKDDTSIFGIGIPEIMRDMQELINACLRALVRNASYSAGPQAEVNVDLLDPRENPEEMAPEKVWLRTGIGEKAMGKAVNFFDVPNHTAHLLALLSTLKTLNDEVVSIPSYMHGDNEQAGAGKTARGLSMLMGAANLTTKDAVDNFDEGITKPFLGAMHDFNMEYNPDPKIKGDFKVMPTGASSLVAREIRAQQITEFANLTRSPDDKAIVNRGVLLRELATLLELPEKSVRPEEETDLIRQLQQQLAMTAEQLKRVMAELERMAKAGKLTAADPPPMMQEAANG